MNKIFINIHTVNYSMYKFTYTDLDSNNYRITKIMIAEIFTKICAKLFLIENWKYTDFQAHCKSKLQAYRKVIKLW